MYSAKRNGRQSIKKQWYLLYSVVLIVPLLIMFLSYRYSYKLLADEIYERQYSHLTHIRDNTEVEINSMSSTMLSFASNKQVKKASEIKDPYNEQQMLLFMQVAEDVHNQAINYDLLEYYMLYFPESGHIVESRYYFPDRVLYYPEYHGTIKAIELEKMLNVSNSGALNLMVSESDGRLVLYMRVPVYGNRKTLYVAAILKNDSLLSTMESGLSSAGSLIGIESLDGDIYLCNNIELYRSFQNEGNDWFLVKTESKTLPIRFFYACPRYVIEEKLSSYQYIMLGYAVVGLSAGLVFIFFAIKHQYKPIDNLMGYISPIDRDGSNEYSNIGSYLQQANERNERHILIDMLLGNISETSKIEYSGLILVMNKDKEPATRFDRIALQERLQSGKVVAVNEQIVVIMQNGAADKAYISQTLSELYPAESLYVIYIDNDGQSLQQAYSRSNEMMTILRFFDAPTDKIYCISREELREMHNLQILNRAFEDRLKSAIYSGREEEASSIMNDALADMRKYCQTVSTLRSCLYTISALFIKLEASIHAQNPNMPDGISGDVITSYNFSGFKELQDTSLSAIHDMVASLNIQMPKSNTLPEQIVEYIQQNYRDPNMSVDCVAEHLGFSPAYVRRIYKQAKGEGITDTLLRLRIQASKELLLKPGSKVNDIAVQVGFWEVATFIRSFKKIEGITPGAYKNQGMISETQEEE